MGLGTVNGALLDFHEVVNACKTSSPGDYKKVTQAESDAKELIY